MYSAMTVLQYTDPFTLIENDLSNLIEECGEGMGFAAVQVAGYIS